LGKSAICARFQYTSPQTVYDHLRNPQNFVGLQPLLTHLENIKVLQLDDRRSVSYDTVEAFRWKGLVLYRNRIRVRTVFTDPPHQFETVVHSFPNITVRVTYTFNSKDGGTRVHETMRISCHAWLANFVIDQALRAQTAVLANLKKRLDGGE
jgi:hypothetical protein